jgi:hypothetical protein
MCYRRVGNGRQALRNRPELTSRRWSRDRGNVGRVLIQLSSKKSWGKAAGPAHNKNPCSWPKTDHSDRRFQCHDPERPPQFLQSRFDKQEENPVVSENAVFTCHPRYTLMERVAIHPARRTKSWRPIRRHGPSGSATPASFVRPSVPSEPALVPAPGIPHDGPAICLGASPGVILTAALLLRSVVPTGLRGDVLRAG